MNLITETHAVIPEYTQDVMDMTMDFLYQEEDRDHLWPHNLEYYIKNINDWMAVSFYKRGSETVGFSCAQEYPGGARLMSRLYKSPYIRNTSKIPLTTASKNIVEIVDVTNGPKRIKNSTNFLERAIKNIENKNFIKNRLSCKYCEFYKTEHCK